MQNEQLPQEVAKEKAKQVHHTTDAIEIVHARNVRSGVVDALKKIRSALIFEIEDGGYPEAATRLQDSIEKEKNNKKKGSDVYARS